MKAQKDSPKLATFMLLLVVVVFLFSGFSTMEVTASPSSSFYYRLMVDREGATTTVINFQSTDSTGASWVIVPKDWNSTPNVISGTIVQSSLVDTSQVVGTSQYFYQAYKFTYQASSITSIFNMTIQFTMDTGALIIEHRGIFFSPLISFDYPSSSGTAEVLFDSSLTVNFNNVIAIWERYQPVYESGISEPTRVDAHRVVFDLTEKLHRLQIEFRTGLPTEYTTLQSVNKVFTFDAVKKYSTYASNILNLYDRIYNDYTRLFNVTLTPPVDVQFFLPSFDELLSVGGFTPFTEAGAGRININIFFVRTVNGTIEVIAAHELVHHFLIKSELSPNDFLWFHEGMAQYVSVTLVEKLGFEGAQQEKQRLEQGASQLLELLDGPNFGLMDPFPLQDWSPSYSPPNVGNYYAASYYIVSRLAEMHGGLEYYERFFSVIHGEPQITDINRLANYLSLATSTNASVALTLKLWGFRVVVSSEITEKIDDAQRAIAAVSPVFQPYKSLAEFLYKQALLSLERGDIQGGTDLLQLAIIIADLAPLLTLFTLAAIIGIIVYLLRRSSKRAKLKAPVPQPPPPPPAISSESSV
jgi:hypothetical protein